MRTLSNLWRHADFLKLWAGESVSLFGSQMTALAVPLMAAIAMHATSSQMGMLVAAQFAPYLLITLFAGAWIDGHRRKPLLMLVNIGRAVLLALIPALYLLGDLNMPALYTVIFLTSLLTVLFELAYQSYFPTLVDSEYLVEGNSKLQVSASIAQVGGPSAAGVLIAWMSAPFVILLNAASYLFSVFTLASIRTIEPVPLRTKDSSIREDIALGMKLVFNNPYIRSIAAEAATYNLFAMVTMAVLVLYMTRELHIGAAMMGFIMGTASVGALCGSLAANYIGKRLSVGKTIVWSMIVACAAPILVPLAGGSHDVVIATLIVSFFIDGFGLVISNVYAISLRQSLIPQHLLGRFYSAYRFLCSAATPIGAYFGGVLGEVIGLRATLFVGAIGTIFATGWVIFSPVSKLRELPKSAELEGYIGETEVMGSIAPSTPCVEVLAQEAT